MTEGSPPEQRTAELAQSDFGVVAEVIKGYDIFDLDTGAKVRIKRIINFPRLQNQKGIYRILNDVPPLEIQVLLIQGNPIALVATLDNGQQGACVKLDSGEEIKGQERVRLGGPVAVARALNLSRDLPRARLAFMDYTDTLYLLRP